MAVTRKSSNSRSVQGFFKWIIKCFLIQVGCLSRQEFEEQYPPNGESFENLIDCIDNLDTKADHRSLKNKSRLKAQNETFVEDVNEFNNCESGENKSKDKTSGGIMSFQNCTLQSADQGNGESYWVSFEEKSFSKGNGFKVYSGRMNGTGPKSGDKCVVKVFRQCQGTENLCRNEVKKCHKAKALAKDFNSLMHGKKVRVKFTTLYWAHMDEVSKIKQIFFSGVRKLSTRESVLFEDDLRFDDEKPNKHRELIMFMDCQGKNKRCVAKDLNAFAHFTYHKSNGELVLCGLDGVQDDGGFFLKTPTIHSRTHGYGNSDQGLHGILEVFRNHICSDFCKDMIKPNVELNNLPVDCNNHLSAGQCSIPLSAPQEHEHIIPKVVNCNHHPPLERQNSVVSGESLISDHTLTWRQGSNISQITESLSGYIEPTAPIEDCNEFVFHPSPPPYSLHVANWILHEHSQNRFINTTSCQQMSQTRSDDFVNQVSVESGLGVNVITSREGSCFRGTSLDLNANFPEEDVDTSGISTSCCFDDCDDNDQAISIQCSKKRVRFSLSSGICSNNLSSETTNSTTSECSNEMPKMTCGTRMEEFSSSQRHHCAGSFLSNNCQDNLYSCSHVVNHNCGMTFCGTVNINLDANNPLPESPPSYTDSERRVQSRFLPGRANIGNTDIPYQNTVIANRVHGAVANSGSIDRRLKK